MKTWTVLSVVGICMLAASATSAQRRTLEEIEGSYELVLGQVTLPGNTAGTISFKECDTCDTRALRVSTATEYYVNGTLVALADLQRIAGEIRQGRNEADTGVYVDYDLKTNDVKRVRVEQLGR